MVKNKGSSQRSGHERSLDSLKRRGSFRQPRECILIVCEGAETEPNYFKALVRALRLPPLVEVVIEGPAGVPISIVNRALEMREERSKQPNKPKFDEIWCVFDTENPAKVPSLKPAIDKARANNLRLAVSNPAFEYWYLLHFKETDMIFANASAVLSELKSRDCLPNYQKNSQAAFIETYKNIEIAIERAHRLLTKHPDFPDNQFPNPSTTVYELVEKLKSMVIKSE